MIRHINNIQDGLQSSSANDLPRTTTTTYWTQLPYELKSEIVSHHIDNILDDLQPSYWHASPYDPRPRRPLTASMHHDWVVCHPFYQELYRVNDLIGDMSIEIERLCKARLLRDYPGFSAETKLDVTRAQARFEVPMAVYLYNLKRLRPDLYPEGSVIAQYPEGHIVTAMTAILEQVKEQRIL